MPNRPPIVPLMATESVAGTMSCDLGRLLVRWCQRHRQRRDLGQLDDHMLADIGVTRAMADAERRKPFWR
ncbi:DUF1127 domain-containing protein [Mesorhizobium sp. CAU 1741]|uniref:DUF1127 domain-containing protein n=1 Tax=Mesorhizobium sp. CAU 1741 TaxID=3140366 RepID=UPI00325C2812